MRLGVVVVYSTIDRFLWPVLRSQIEQIADSVSVCRRTHLLGGEPEELHDLGVPTVTLGQAEIGSPAINEMRRVAMEALPECDRVLFLDSDELFDVERIKPHLGRHCPTYFRAEVYWRQPNVRQFQGHECAGLLCRREDVVWPEHGERGAMTRRLDHFRYGAPFMHHFAWCKPLDQMLRKVRNWGHAKDRPNWAEQVQAEWASPLPGTCFVHKRRRPVAFCAAPSFAGEIEWKA